MEPTIKHPEIESVLEEVAGRTTAIRADRCINAPIGCGKPITGFRDELSAREYRISGLCQACQDVVFVPPVESDEPEYVISPALRRLLEKQTRTLVNVSRPGLSRRQKSKWKHAYRKLLRRINREMSQITGIIFTD